MLPASDEEVMRRRLNDGATYDIVKNFWTSDELEVRLGAVGLELTVRETPTYFQFGIDERRLEVIKSMSVRSRPLLGRR